MVLNETSVFNNNSTLDQASVVLFETIDGTALAEKDDYTTVKKAIIFDANETQKQVKIYVNDEFDEEIQDDLDFGCRIIPVSDHVMIKDGEADIIIAQPISAIQIGHVKGTVRILIWFKIININLILICPIVSCVKNGQF